MGENRSSGKAIEPVEGQKSKKGDNSKNKNSLPSMKDSTKPEKVPAKDVIPDFDEFIKMTKCPVNKLKHGQGYNDKLGLTYIGSYPQSYYGYYGISREEPIRAIHENKETQVKLADDIKVLRGYTDSLTDKTLRHIRELLEELHKNKKIGHKPISTILENLIYRSQLYLDFPNDVIRLIFTLWIIGTYLRSMFMWYPYLCFEGLRDVGKSTALEFLSLSCFNGGGDVSGGYTEADLHKSADSTMGFFAIDHLEEKLKSKDKRQILNEFLENAWKLNASINKREQNTGEQLKLYLACSVSLGTRRTTETIAEKGLIIQMQETADEELRKRSVIMHKDKYFENVERDLMRVALNYQDKIKETYENIPVISGLGREYNKFLPFLAIAKVIDEETGNKNNYFNRLKSYALEYRKNRKSESEDTEELLLRLILQNKIDKATYNSLSDLMKGEGYDKYSWQTAKSDISKLGIVKHYDKTKSPISLDLDLERAQKRGNARGIIIDYDKQEDKQDDRRVELTGKELDPKKLTLTEKAIWSILVNCRSHTVSSIITELKESDNYQEDNIKEALQDMEKREEIIILGVV